MRLFRNQQICQGDAFKEIVDHLVQLVPHRAGLAALGAGTGGGALGGAGDGGEPPLGELENAPHGVALRFPVQAVAAALALDRVHKTAF